MDDWTLTAKLDSKGQFDVIYTDFAKTFHTVAQHTVLKLKTYNTDTDLVLRTTNFLCNGKQS